MSGGAGGIIRRSVRQTAELSVVQENLPKTRCMELKAVLAKGDADWTRKEFRRVQALIAKAEAEC